MRVRHRIVAIGLLIATLLPCLTFLEFVELTTFHDDPSNAFILTSPSSRFSVIADRRIATNETENTPQVFAAGPRRTSLFEVSPARAPQDLLALFSLWRT